MASTKKTVTKKDETKKTKKDIKNNTSKQPEVSNKVITIICIVAAVLLVGVYLYRINRSNDNEKYTTSYLIESGTVSLEINNLNEVSQILSEAPNEYFVLITYNENKDTYNLETGLKEVIDKYGFSDAFYYFDTTDLMEKENYINDLNEALNTDIINTVPTILYYKDKKLVDVVKRIDSNVINAGDFQHLLDIYYIDR